MIRALIVDDEAPARRKLRDLLGREGDVEVVGEASDGAEALAAIRATAPDVVFLDVQMPRLDGFDVIAEMSGERRPLIVFVTAYDEHALRAFEVEALDYLVKPFAPSRFERLLSRVRRTLQGAASTPGADLAARLERLLAAVRPPPGYLRQILVGHAEGRQLLLAVGEIERIQARGNYLALFTEQGEFQRRGTLRELEERLDPASFLRLNRSEIVRLDAVREVQPWFHGDARVVLKNGTILTWSRRFRPKDDDRF